MFRKLKDVLHQVESSSALCSQPRHCPGCSSKSLIINEKRMINDQKVNTYFQRIIDFLDLLNLIFNTIKHNITGCVRQVLTTY